MHRIHTLKPYFPMIHFNIIIQYMPRSTSATSTLVKRKKPPFSWSLHFRGRSVASEEFCFTIKFVDLSHQWQEKLGKDHHPHITEAFHAIHSILPVFGFLSSWDTPQTFIMQLIMYNGKLMSISLYCLSMVIMNLPWSWFLYEQCLPQSLL
jgi:hypothetical protein